MDRVDATQLTPLPCQERPDQMFHDKVAIS